MKKLVIALFIIGIGGVCSVKAQRHYSGVRAIDMSYGLNIFGRDNTHLNVSISRYRNRTTYWKGGLNFLEKSFTYKLLISGTETDKNAVYNIECSTGRAFYGDVNYFKTLATNRISLWLNGSVGTFLGVEVYRNPNEQVRFVMGPKVSLEGEFFITSRIAILGQMEQQWSPFSKLKKWNTYLFHTLLHYSIQLS